MSDHGLILIIFSHSLSLLIHIMSLGVTFIQMSNRDATVIDKSVFLGFPQLVKQFSAVESDLFWTFQTPLAGRSLRRSRGWPGWWSPRWWRWRSRWWRPPSVRRVHLSPQSDLAKGRSQYLSFLCLSCGTLNKLGLIVCWIFGNHHLLNS